MQAITRYLGLWASLAKFSLLGEMAFRGNFVVKVFVELLWLAILLLFNFTLFEHTSHIADWNQHQYLFFLGCYFAMGGVLETLFLSNCNEFAELVRTGDLDFFLLRPVDEQFLVSCRNVDWSCAPNVVLGFGVMGYALWRGLGRAVAQHSALSGAVHLRGGPGVWFFVDADVGIGLVHAQPEPDGDVVAIRHAHALPAQIFLRTDAVRPIGIFFSTVIPIMLVTNVPARVLAKQVSEPWTAAYTFVAAAAVLWLSRRVFRAALQRYRSASS